MKKDPFVSTMAVKPQGNYALEHMIRGGNNPYQEAHTQKAFEIKKPKTQLNAPDQSAKVGSPWAMMGVKK